MLFCLYAAGDPTSAVPIFVIAALFGTARAFAAPSFRSLPPLIAPDGGLPRLIALYSGTWQFGLIVGPAASGFLYDVDPDRAVRRRRRACFAAAAVLAARRSAAPPAGPHAADERPSLHHAMEGLRFIRGQPVLLGAIALDMFAVLFGGAVALLPAIAEDRLGVGNVGYGWLRAAPGIGAVVVTAVLAVRPVSPARRPHAARRRRRLRRGDDRARPDPRLRRRLRRPARAGRRRRHQRLHPGDDRAAGDARRHARSGDGRRERVHRRVQRARRVRVGRRRGPARRRAGGRPSAAC